MVMIFGVCTAHAGAWLLPQGEGQVISHFTYSASERAYDASRKVGARVDFKKSEQSVYVEYGLTRRVTVVASGAVQDISYIARDGRERYNGLAPARLGVRAALPSVSKRWILSVQPSLIIPSGGENVPDADLGRGGTGGELRVLAGRNLRVAGRPAFFDAQAAYEYRGSDAPQQASIDLTLGVDITRKVQLMGQVFSQYTTAGRFDADDVLENDSVKLQGSVVYKYGAKSAVQFGVFDTVTGRNTVRQSGVSVGLWQRF